ncbi:hypothetical protein T09_8241 [Trichinella sp. T9]|nr:hypothetical protein T09_8241 [Trichinella sp. T9]
MPWSTSITLGYSVHCSAISLAGGQLQFRSSTPSVNNWIAPPSTPHHFNPHFGIINWFKFEYYVVNVAFSEVQPYLIQCNIWIEIYIYINDDEASGLWYVAEYDSKLATPSIPHDFNPNRIIILTIMLLCFYRLHSCASDSQFWFQSMNEFYAEGVIIIEAFSNSCRFAQHGIKFTSMRSKCGIRKISAAFGHYRNGLHQILIGCQSVQSNYADARAIIAVPNAKVYHQLMPPSSADIHSELNVVSTHIPESENESNNTWKGTVKLVVHKEKPQAFPPGYAPGQIKICICPQAMPKAFYCTIFDLRGAPGFPPRLCPRANKNLHMPSSYAKGILLHNICPKGSFMQILGATPQAKF